MSTHFTPDVDPTMWGFQGKEAYERRVYFWNLVSGSLWQVHARSDIHYLDF